jgi:hypothetical protein
MMSGRAEGSGGFVETLDSCSAAGSAGGVFLRLRVLAWVARPRQASGQERSVGTQDITFVTISHKASRGPWAVLRQMLSPGAKIRPWARHQQSMGL